MFNKIRFSVKIPTFILGAAVITGLGLGVASYLTAADGVDKLVTGQLSGVTKISQTRFESYFNTIENELHVVASNPNTVTAIEKFTDAWQQFDGNTQAKLQAAYIDNNQHPVGQKHLLDVADTGTYYDDVHSKYHPWFRELQQTSGYYDVFLFDTEGDLIYSVFKELDFATNFGDNGGKWTDTDLGIVFRKAMKLSGSGAFVFEDFAPYAPSANAPASFMATPVYDDNGEKIGVLAFQMPIDRINETINADNGLGSTGETFLMGSDGLLRNDSGFTQDKNDILKTQIDTSIINEVFSSETTMGVANFYRDEPMKYASRTFDYQGVEYALVAMKSESAMLLPVTQIRNQMIMVGLGLLAILGVLGWIAGRSITRPIGALVCDMKELASGNTKLDLDGADRIDEIGDMTRAVMVFRDGMIERERLQAETNQTQVKSLERQTRVEKLISEFQSSVNATLQMVASDADTMSDTAALLTNIAGEAKEKASNAASASDSASVNVQMVATAAEELSSSISEITRQVERADEVVGNATTASQDTNNKVASLADAANKIGDVVSLISEIAEQTNLLALNATIEAARAGDAGRGFAVVASEVKALATQTAKATEEIASQVKAIQGSTGDAVESINGITETIAEVDHYMSAIATAIEQQGMATGEISQNVNQAAVGTETVVDNIGGVSVAASETAQSAIQVANAATSVNDETRQLNGVIEQFLDDVAAA